ncbi:MAG: alanine racemase [Thermoleophilia bacterium]|nr:alanine racemase [Thermoleophilia bacterium]
MLAFGFMRTSPRSSVLIDLDAIRHNVAYIKSRLKPQTQLLVPVKADAYGHGMLPVSQAAIAAGACGVAVATAEEAVKLREAGFDKMILVMGPLYSVDQCKEMVRLGVEFAIVTPEMVPMLRELGNTEIPARVHLKVDTGMNRQGLYPSEVPRFLEVLRELPTVHLAGVMTHFACAAEDPSSVDFQLSRFVPVVEQVRREWPQVIVHAANSAATLSAPHSHFDMVRCGCAVYGLSPWQQDPLAEGLRPALSWRSQVVLLKRVPAGEGVGYGHTFRPQRPTTIALVPIGYGDGVFRALGDRGEVLIGGRRYPMVGRVSMDSFAVDVGEHPSVKVGDTVTLIGADGKERITVEEVAQRVGTINYEITCVIALDRSERLFIDKSDEPKLKLEAE